jgi:hypothetical protein
MRLRCLIFQKDAFRLKALGFILALDDHCKLGEQVGSAQNALRNKKPSSAKRCMFGVSTA